MKTEIQKLADILRHSFEKNAWHGPAVMEVLSALDESIVTKKINTTHSIIELVGHMTVWRTFVTQRLLDNKDFEVTDEMNFSLPKSWPKAINALRDSQEELLYSLEQFPVDRLREIVPDRPYKFFTMINGVIHHDLYHLGQIVLITKIHQ